ncbi:MAG: efflux transporter outer membrane subunit [Vibrio sp.]
MKPVLRMTTMAVCISLSVGCVNHSTFKTPKTDVPQQWQHSKITDTQQAITSQWWTQLNDPTLNQLIKRALNTNNNLILAALTLKKARLNAGLDERALYPDLSSTTSAQRSKSLDNGDSTPSFSTNLNLNYEVDLWSKLARQKDASAWAAIASREDLEATAQSLVATTAQLYWKVNYLNQRLLLSNENIKAATSILKLVNSQYSHGAVSRLNVLEAKRNLAGLQATHSSLVQQFVESRNALAVLFNQAPKAMTLPLTPLPTGELPKINAGIPAQLLKRRPDVKSALFQLKSALATKDATDAAFFPQLNLTGALGSSSDQLSHLLSNPIGTLGASLTLPFLNWNEMQINRDISDVNYQTAVVNYRETLYAAFEDVNNALSSRINLRIQQDKLQQQYNNAAEAENIYLSQYENGAIGINDLLDAQENARNAKAALLENRYNQLVNLATVYQSLGGKDVLKNTDTLLPHASNAS